MSDCHRHHQPAPPPLSAAGAPEGQTDSAPGEAERLRSAVRIYVAGALRAAARKSRRGGLTPSACGPDVDGPLPQE